MGGVERLLASLSTLLAARFEVHVASFDPPGTVPAVQLDVPFHPLGSGPTWPAALRPVTYAAQRRRLRRLERELGVDVTISNLWRADLVSALSRAGGRRPRRISLAHINVVGNPTNRLMVRLRPLVAATYRRLDRVVAVSEALARELAALYRLPADRVSAVPNFVAVPAGLGGSARIPGRLVWCGRMVTEKNLPALVSIVAELAASGHAVSLDVIGSGPERDAAEQEAALAPHAIHFLGLLDDPLPVIARAAVLALPSHSEGLPMVLLEALALGTPVAASDCAGGGVHQVLRARTPHDPHRQEVEEVPAGVLLPIPDTVSHRRIWASALVDLVSDAPRLSAAADAARALAADHTPEAVAGKWDRILEEVLA
jgi:N-acetylgalactosamine-N,N'-diacetylbacillosaminyl-diphospho-undecaprenol 4-alpha-N-acetylgalactosaminyltransferase